MANKKDYDFAACRYDPNAKDFVQKIRNDVVEFNVYKEDDADQVFAYVVMLFDMRSPLWDAKQEYFQRKLLAADLAGLSKSHSGNWSVETKEILEGVNHGVNALCVAYLAQIGNMDYMMLINELVMFHGYTMAVMSNDYDAQSYKILKELSDGINQRTRKIFGSGEEDELTRIRVLLYEQGAKDRQRLNPEAIIKLLNEDGDFPADWNPYGKNYTIDNLKFFKDEHTEG